MLVLSRKQQQRVLVGDSIVITLVKVAGGKVRLGIEAPPEVRVVREELVNRPRGKPVEPPIAPVCSN